MTIFSAITEKERIKDRYSPHSTVKIRLVQHGAAIPATTELLLSLLLAYDRPWPMTINFTSLSRILRRYRLFLLPLPRRSWFVFLSVRPVCQLINQSINRWFIKQLTNHNR